MKKLVPVLAATNLVAGITAIYFWQQLQAERQAKPPVANAVVRVEQLQQAVPALSTRPLANQTRQMGVQPSAESPNPEANESITESRNAIVSIPIPREFDLIVPTDSPVWHANKVRQLHERLEQEPIDPAWSAYAELTIHNAITAVTELSRHGVPTVNCRAKTCQVHMVVYGASDVNDGKWSKLFGEVRKRLETEFNMEDFSVGRQNDLGLAVMVLYLSKK